MSTLARLVRELDRRLGSVEARLGSEGRTGTVVAVAPGGETVDVEIAADVPVVVRAVPVDGAYAVPEVGHAVVMKGGIAPVAMAPVSPVPAAMPPEVTGVAVMASVGALDIRWDAVNVTNMADNKGAYEIQVDTSIAFDSVELIDLVTAGTAKSISGLQTGTPYFVQVRAINYQGVAGPWSTIVPATPNVDALASRIGTTELRHYGVEDINLAQYVAGWPISLVNVAQPRANICQFAWCKYRQLGGIGGLVVCTYQIAMGADMLATGTAGQRIEIIGTGPTLIPDVGFVYGSWSLVDGSNSRRYTGTPQPNGHGDGFFLYYGDGAVRTTGYLGEDPSMSFGLNSYFNGFIIFEGAHDASPPVVIP